MYPKFDVQPEILLFETPSAALQRCAITAPQGRIVLLLC